MPMRSSTRIVVAVFLAFAAVLRADDGPAKRNPDGYERRDVEHRLLCMKNPELEAIYQQAMDRKLYDKVNDRFGRQGPAYARSNAAEYFAEISCAFLDSCNYFPFNYDQLRGHDPAGFKFA